MNTEHDWKNFETTGRVEDYLNYLGKYSNTNIEAYGQTVEHRQTGDVDSERIRFGDGNGTGDRSCQ